MGKGLGIAVLIVAALAIIIPIYGIYLGVITAILGIVVAVLKERAMAVAIGALNILNAVFLTPSLKLAQAGEQLATGHSSQMSTIFWVWVICGLVAIVLAFVAGRSKSPKEVSAASAH
jgi:hypothetical protein